MLWFYLLTNLMIWYFYAQNNRLLHQELLLCPQLLKQLVPQAPKDQLVWSPNIVFNGIKSTDLGWKGSEGHRPQNENVIDNMVTSNTKPTRYHSLGCQLIRSDQAHMRRGSQRGGSSDRLRPTEFPGGSQVVRKLGFKDKLLERFSSIHQN